MMTINTQLHTPTTKATAAVSSDNDASIAAVSFDDGGLAAVYSNE